MTFSPISITIINKQHPIFASFARHTMHHHSKFSIVIISLLIPIITCDSSEQATDKSIDPSDPHFVDKKLAEINKKTDQVKGFINDIPKFLDSIHTIQKAEKDLADKITSDEAKIKAAQGRSKRAVAPQADMMAGERYKADSNNVINSNTVMSKDELVDHSIDYINNTLPEVKSKLVSSSLARICFHRMTRKLFVSLTSGMTQTHRN